MIVDSIIDPRIDSFYMNENCPYLENAQCKLWKRTLFEIFSCNRSTIKLIQEYFGLCLTTKVTTKFLLLFGEGSNGKSLILKVLKDLIGPKNYSVSTLRDLQSSRNSVPIYHKLVNICSELDPKDTRQTDVLKKLVDREEIILNPKYKPAFGYKSYAKFIFACNDLPETNDNTFAFRRRLPAIPFNNRFVEKPTASYERQIDTNRLDELYKELPGVLNWALKGLKRLKKNNYKFTFSKEVDLLNDEIEIHNNTVFNYIDNRISCEEGSL